MHTARFLPPGPALPALLQGIHYAFRPGPFFEACARRYGECFTLRMPVGPPIEVMFSNPEAIRQIFTGNEDELRGGEAFIALQPLLGANSILALDGARHERERRLMMPPFHGERMLAYGETMRAIADRAIERWPIGRPFPIHPEMQAITLEVILRTVFGARKLIVLDEMVNVRTDFEAMLRMLNELDFTYDFPNGMRADHLSREAIALMKGRIGMLSMSAESATQADLDGPIGKGQPLQAIRRVAEWCRELDVPLMSHYIIGFPWETPAHVTATLEMAWELYDRYGVWPSMQFATPILGTALHDQCAALGLVPPEGLDLKDGALFQHRPCFDPPGCPPGYVGKARAAFDMKLAAREARKLIMNITYKCANRCVFCATGDRVSAALAWDKIENILREHREQGTDQLDIDGGEPTMHPRLVDAIGLARELGYRSINVTTNGRLLRDRTLAERLLNSGITHLLISLHGATAAVHEAATDAPGSFADTIAGIDHAMALHPAHVETGLNVTIVRANVDHLMPLTALAVAKGFSKINFQFTTPFGRAWEDVVPPLEEAANAVMRVIDRYANEIQIHVINAQFCVFPGYERYVVGDLQKLGRTMVFAADPRFPEQVNLYQWLGARREKRAVCVECPWTTACEGFQVFAREKPDMRLERSRPFVATA